MSPEPRPNPLKDLLGNLPFAADAYWLLRQKNRPLRSHYSLEQLRAHLPQAVAEARPFAAQARPGRRIAIFATLHYWIEQAAMIALLLRAQGHQVTLLTLPYSDWRKTVGAFDLRQRALYTRDVLRPAGRLLHHISLLGLQPVRTLPPELEAGVRAVSLFDAQYTLQVEDVPEKNATLRLRQERNLFAARTALGWLQSNRPDLVLVPNGLILELGAIYRTARSLGLPAFTYEFNDQKEQIWLAQNAEIMRQDTDALWQARGAAALSEDEWERIRQFEQARAGARLWGKSVRIWQNVTTQGADEVRAALQLDGRPVVLLATNVLGDSLTLGRQKFSSTMSEWIARTVQYFAGREDVQLVVRIHPGESLMRGPSIAEVIHQALPGGIPTHFRLIPPQEKINTYDLMEAAGLGLVYTTTTGLEMAMTGKPVMVCGQTHYRGRGFTLDPESWDEYFSRLETLLSDLPAHRLGRRQIELAWRYAYHFFFNFARPFPWRLMHFWDDVGTWPLARVLSPEGLAEFGETLTYLAGEPIRW